MLLTQRLRSLRLRHTGLAMKKGFMDTRVTKKACLPPRKQCPVPTAWP